MRRLLLLGLSTIALLVAGSLLWLSRLGGTDPGLPAPPLATAAPVAIPSLPAPPPPPLPSPPGAATGQPPAPPLPAPAPARPRRWETVIPTSIAAWPQLFAALAAARPRLTPCFDETTQARYGPRPFSAVGQPRPGPGHAVLLLEVEADPSGRLQLVDAPVETRGAEQDGLFSCVQEALRGMTLPGQGSPGTRYRIRFPLSPTGVGPAAQPLRGPRLRY